MKHRIRWMLIVLGWSILVVRPPILGYEEPHHTKSQTQAPGIAFVHTSNTLNISTEITYIDHPQTNLDPNAMLLVTVNRNPGGRMGIPLDRTLGVKYDTLEYKWGIFNQDLSPMPVGVDFNVLIVTANPEGFIHVATSENIVSNWTCIDNALTNDNPDAVVMVTQNYNPGLSAGIYNDHVIGVWYSQAVDKWCIYNQDKDPMPEGAGFNILVVNDAWHSYVHTATSGNTIVDTSFSFNPLSQGTPNAVIFATQNWNPGGSGGTYNYHEVALLYDFHYANWSIQNQNGVLIPENAAFNLLVVTSDSASFVHTAIAVTHTGPGTWLWHPLIDDIPSSRVFITHNNNPSGADGIRNNHPTGVGYFTPLGDWFIYNNDGEELTENTAFNVLITGSDSPAFIHRTTSLNIANNVTFIDHPLTNDNSNARILITPNWNPEGGTDGYSRHPIGVYYSASQDKWSVFNQDLVDMAAGDAFNVLVVTTNPNSFVHKATQDNTSSGRTCINHPLTNSNPNGIIFVTQNYNPGGLGGIYNPHYICVYYNWFEKKWCISVEDFSPMPTDAAFNVLVIGNRILLPVVLR